MSRTGLRRSLLAAIAVLYALSIPWYRSAEAEPDFVVGVPGWVLVSIGCYVAIAVLNALAWLVTDIPADDEDSR